MRALWCFLVVVSLLSPLGSAGITLTPGDAETTLAAPRPFTVVAAAARRLAEPDAPVVVVEPVLPVIAQRVSAVVERPIERLRSQCAEHSARSRAPPV